MNNKIFPIIGLWSYFIVALALPTQCLSEEGESFNHPDKKKKEYIQLIGVTDLRSKFSDGCFTLQTLAEMCVERKIDVMIVMDHDRYSLEYGIFPFRNIFRKKVQKNSLLINGARNYLRAFENLSYEFNDLIAIPGVESAPFYYWSGSFLSGDLTANLWEKHISIVGMRNPKDYEELPTLNSNFSTKYFRNYFKGFFLFFLSSLVGAILIFFGEYFRIGGILILVLNALLMISYHPFRSSPFDQYHGPQGVAPWQLTIDYANERGGMTFWHHMESSSGIGKKGPINVNTPPHSQDLLLTHGYTGFQAVYEDTITVTEPGHEWDRALLQFLRGERKNAIWGIGGHDYHCEGTSGIRFNDVKTVFLVKRKSKDGVLNAMRKGRMYAVRQPQKKKYRLSLDEFSIQGGDGSKSVTMGDTIALSERPNIRIKISATDRKEHKLTLSLVRSGEKIKEFNAATPADFRFTDNYYKPGETIFYRLEAFIRGDNYLIANPIFVSFQEGEEESEDVHEKPKKVSPVLLNPLITKKEKEEKAVEKPLKSTPTPKIVVLYNKSVTLREGPGTNFKKLGMANRGDRFALLETTDILYQKVPWLKVADKEGKEVFLWGGLVSVKETGEKDSLSLMVLKREKKLGQALKSGVKIRTGPGLKSEIIRTTGAGETFEILGLTKEKHKGKSWYHVRFDGNKTGYIWSPLVR